jgi:hypothetical protein
MFFDFHAHFKCDRGMSHPDRLRRKTISILIHSFIRFRSLRTINTCLWPPETQIWIIIEFV